MNLKRLALVAAAGTTLLVAAPAFAEHRDSWREESHGWRAPQHRPHHDYGNYDRHQYRHHYGHYRARGYYMPPAPVYYTPPEPYYYAPPAPRVYGHVPLGHGTSIGFSLPLN